MVWARGFEPHVFSVSGKTWQIDLGRGTDICSSVGYCRTARSRKIQHRAGSARANHTRALGYRRVGQQRLVSGGSAREGGCEPDAAAMVRQLQNKAWLVRRHGAYRHRGLEGQ